MCSYEAKKNKLSFPRPPNFDKISKNLNTPSLDSLPGGSSVQTFHVSLLWRLLDEVHGLKIKQNLASLHAPTFSTKPWQPHTQFPVSFPSGFPPVDSAFNLVHNQHKYFLFNLISWFLFVFCLMRQKSQAILKLSKYNGPARTPPEPASLARKAVKM